MLWFRLTLALSIANVVVTGRKSNLRHQHHEKRHLAANGVLTSNDKEMILDKHNEYRSITALGNTEGQPMATNMTKLVWDENLASSASTKAAQCTLTAGAGETVYLTGSRFDRNDNINTLLRLLKGIYNNNKNYNYNTMSCEKNNCKSYVRMVWSETLRVGCGYSRCNGTELMNWEDHPYAILFVCRYNPPNNNNNQDNNQKPYGEAATVNDIASACPPGFTPDKTSGLCVPPPVMPTISPVPTTSSAPSRPPAQGGLLTTEEEKLILDKHNEFRSDTALGKTPTLPMAANMPELIWDSELASEAAKKAAQCRLTSGEGESAAASASRTDTNENIQTLLGLTTRFYQGYKNYNYTDVSCEEGAVCGNFLQTVWADTLKVGCGYARCKGDELLSAWENFTFAILYYCKYDPPSNDRGQDRFEKPYKEAKSEADVASECPRGYTANQSTGLCVLSTDPTISPAPTTSFAPSATPGSKIGVAEQIILDKLNDLRSATALGETKNQPMAKNMTQLEWDSDLAKEAGNKASQCVFSAGPGESVTAHGSVDDTNENMRTVLGLIDTKYNNNQFYNYTTMSCSPGRSCGSYTQMVWSETLRVGCGYARCNGPDLITAWKNLTYAILFVCKYDPPSNINGRDRNQKPYGEAKNPSEIASNCPEGYTANKARGLCVMIPIEPTLSPAPTISIVPSLSPVASGVLRSSEEKMLLDKHNEYRSKTALGQTIGQPRATNLTKLVWDENLASMALTKAQQCKFTANVGESLSANGSHEDDNEGIDTLLRLLGGMYDLSRNYNYNTMSCIDNKPCGSYSQLVWSETFRVGCAYSRCNGPELIPSWENLPFAILFVCKYAPPSNNRGQNRFQKPYEMTSDPQEVASNCPGGFLPDMESGLCVPSS